MALAASGPAGAGFPASLLRLGGGTGSEDVMEGVGLEAEQEVRIGMEDDGHGGGTEMRIGIG